MEAWILGPPKRQMEFDMEQRGYDWSQEFRCTYRLEGIVDVAGYWKSNAHEAQDSAAMVAFKTAGLPVRDLRSYWHRKLDVTETSLF